MRGQPDVAPEGVGGVAHGACIIPLSDYTSHALRKVGGGPVTVTATQGSAHTPPCTHAPHGAVIAPFPLMARVLRMHGDRRRSGVRPVRWLAPRHPFNTVRGSS
jgi:hypothetical protein